MRGGIVALLAGSALLAQSARAEEARRGDTLREALIAAYATNPTLGAARETQRATDEGVPIARADGLPGVSATASETEFVVRNPFNTVSPTRAASFAGTLSVPIYAGGAVRNAVRAAQARVRSGQAGLKGQEQSLFSSVVAAYMDVILDAETVRFNRANVDQLNVNLEATQDRFQIGDLTRTDVAQSQSRLALAQGQLQSAEAGLAAARENYIALVGHAPGALAAPPALPGLPPSAKTAVSAALEANPNLAAARAAQTAAHDDTGAAQGARLPRIGLFANAQRDDYLHSFAAGGFTGAIPNAINSANAGISLSLPLFTGGRAPALVRQAEAREGAAQDQATAAERQVISETRAAWIEWNAARAIIASSRTALDAAQLSLEGVKAENGVGNRTIIEVLNAEQELLNAEVTLETARRNEYVAGFALLAAMGRATARDLGLDQGDASVPLYDPEVHYRAARGALWEWGSDSQPDPAARYTGGTRTVDSPVQNGAPPPP